MTDYKTIDKITTSLLRAEDQASIISNYSALRRKIEAAGFSVHDLVLRTKETKPEQQHLQSVVWESRFEDEKVAHEATKARLKEAEEREFELQRQVNELTTASETPVEDQEVIAMIEAALRVDRRKSQLQQAVMTTEIGILKRKLSAVQAALAE